MDQTPRSTMEQMEELSRLLQNAWALPQGQTPHNRITEIPLPPPNTPSTQTTDGLALEPPFATLTLQPNNDSKALETALNALTLTSDRNACYTYTYIGSCGHEDKHCARWDMCGESDCTHDHTLIVRVQLPHSCEECLQVRMTLRRAYDGMYMDRGQ
ncbi:hypothetical protein M501DRAFT_1016513 [Patellaria atrata CBS 101060]|uniref:Uncharacterized protein n=1 Tax=Patellaria atrata CBS 101060 TaxID=1346257 RepID=A0A9P4SBA1_9PEZI|nr:hypothetical protein M501DRAFT_1016513 [Patellaria atrata CBS 101060]